MKAETMLACAHCGKTLQPKPGRGRPAVYCSSKCRIYAYRARQRHEATRQQLERSVRLCGYGYGSVVSEAPCCIVRYK